MRVITRTRLKQYTLVIPNLYHTIMKKTPFLSYLLAALLACSAIPQALGYDYVLDDTDLANGSNVFNVGKEGHNSRCWYDDARGGMWIDFGESVAVFSGNSVLRNGGVSGQIDIYKYGKLTVAPAGNGEYEGVLVQWMDSNSRLRDWYYGGGYTWPTDYLRIWMQDGSALDYRDQELWLGVFTFEWGATVNITAGMLSVKSIGNWHRDEFNINATINLRDQNGNIGTLNIENSCAKVINLNFEQTMNLRVTKGNASEQLYIEDSTGKITLKTEGYTTSAVKE